MIGYLRGRVQGTLPTITLVVHGVGYEIHCDSYMIDVDGECALAIHEHAPQDAPHELYGFETNAQRDMFRRLIQIKGVGPKVAMRIVSSPAIGIIDDEARFREFCKIRGVGATLAQRVCDEIR